MAFLREYLKVMLPLLVAMVGYYFGAVPFLEPVPKVSRPLEGHVAAAPNETAWWNRFFLPDAWQINPPAVLKTDHGVLLFQRWEQISPERWKLSPLTIVIPRGAKSESGSGSQSVIFIENLDGAEIQFSEPFDLTTGQPPPVIGGHMSGPISIVGPSMDGDPSDELWLRTSEVHIDRRNLWTSQKVVLRIGQSEVEGQDLSIHLDQDLLGKGGQPTAVDSPVKGIEKLELRYVDRVHFDLARGGIWSPKTNDGTKLPAFADVKCGGSFSFDFHSGWAELAGGSSSGVEVIHQVQDQVEDRFQCDQLRLHFAKGLATPTPASTADQKAKFAGWNIDRMEANGRLNSEESSDNWWVRLNVPGLQTRAQGRRLAIDMSLGRLTLSNQLPGSTGAESSRAFFERENLRVWSPEVIIESEQWAKSNAPVPGDSRDSNHLGTLWAAGPGTAQMATQEGDSWKLSWAKRLTLVPDGEEDLLTIDGSANISSQLQGRFFAERFDVWLKQVSLAQWESFKSENPNSKLSRVLADRFHANGQVIIDSQQLRAQVDDMRVWFAYPQITRIQEKKEPTGLQLFGADGTMPNKIVQPMQTGPTLPSAGPGQLASATSGAPANPKPKKFAYPLNVTGPTLRARLVVEDVMRIDDLELEGGVTMTIDQLSEQYALPLTIHGSTLTTNTSEEGNADVQILGNPAQIKIGDGVLEGPEVRFNQKDQLVWMDHPGFLVIPIEVLQKKNDPKKGPLLAPSPTSNMNWLVPPKIEWKGSMVFDGKVARIQGDVSLSGDVQTGPDSRWLLQGNADSMDVHLTQAIPMRSGGSMNSEIARVDLKEKVDLRAMETNARGEQLSLERLSVPWLSIDMKTQTLVGGGWGWFRSRRFGPAANNKQPTLATPGAGQGSQQLQCLHLCFNGRLDGDMANRQIKVSDHVEVLLGPIQNWEQTLDVNELRQLEVSQSFMSCDELRIFSTAGLSWNQQSNGKPSPWELEALRNVKVESLAASGLLRVNAKKVQYVSQTDLLRVEGDLLEPGLIEFPPSKSQPNGARPFLSVLSATINARTLEQGSIQLSQGGTREQPGTYQPGSYQPGTSKNGAGRQSTPLPSPRFGDPNKR